jgi:hypothetical protein
MNKLTSTADPTVLALTELKDDTTVRIVGATDFVACSPKLPDDIEIECIAPVPFTTADGKKGDDLRLNPV